MAWSSIQHWWGDGPVRPLKYWQLLALLLIVISVIVGFAVAGRSSAAAHPSQVFTGTIIRTVTTLGNSATAACNADEVLLSGGFTGGAPIANFPADVRHWTVLLAGGANATASAICAKSDQVQGVQVISTVIPASGASAACPAGTVLTGGGFQTNRFDPAGVNASKPIGNGWYVSWATIGALPLTVNAFALCASSGVKAGTVLNTTTAFDREEPRTARAVSACTANQVLGGGGFEYPAAPYWKLLTSAPQSADKTWITTIRGTHGNGGAAWIVCLNAA